jgi:hypothetical protein
MLARSDFETGENFTILTQQGRGTGFGRTIDGKNIHRPMIEENRGLYN